KPIELTAPNRIQVLPDHHVAVPRKDFLADAAELIENPDVLRAVLVLRNAGTAKDHPAVVMETLRARDVRMIDRELHDGARLGKGSRISVRATLHVLRRPAPRPVAVWIVAADRVFVHATVAVVVYPFLAEQLPLTLLVLAHADHVARIFRRSAKASIRIAPAHLRDVAVAVEIVVAILVHESVAVVVARYLAGARRARRVRLLGVVVPCVGIDRGDDVQHALVEQ